MKLTGDCGKQKGSVNTLKSVISHRSHAWGRIFFLAQQIDRSFTTEYIRALRSLEAQEESKSTRYAS